MSTESHPHTHTDVQNMQKYTRATNVSCFSVHFPFVLALRGFGRLCEALRVLEIFGRLWDGLEGFVRLWKALQALQRFVRLCEVLKDFERLWEALGCVVRF